MERTTRYSKKRAAILAAIRGTQCHPSAEWVYQTLKPAHPDLSLGTVYRNLTLLQTQGEIQSVGVVNGQTRYDGVTEPHSHFVCNGCGQVLDLLQIQQDTDLDRTVSQQYGLVVNGHELTFYGFCPSCMQKIKF
ncbi:MAG: transcriptional repressor [Lawsonibacter sp.]|nr:transcriptional repressor [Lawsonibacter sp.]